MEVDKRIYTVMFIILIVLSFVSAYLYGAIITCDISGGTYTKSMRCVNLSAMNYCKTYGGSLQVIDNSSDWWVGK